MHRRTFLHAGSAAAVGLATLGCAPRVRGVGVPERLGVQLYSLREVFPGDFVGVLDALVRIGYREVEFAGYHDRPPAAVRGALDSAGLTAPAAHVPIEVLEADLDAVLAAAAVVGHRYLVCPWLVPERRTSMDDYRRLAASLDGIGERCRAAGVQFAYHNHEFEFETFGGERPAYDVLLEETDAANVAMEMDLFWTHKAGQDPLAYFARYPGRFPLWHVKDSTADGAMADVGSGVIDWPALFAQAEQAGLRHAFVEHDEPADPLGSVEASFRYLDRLRG